MNRRVVFAGGVQTQALARAYRDELAPDTDHVFCIGTEALAREAAHQAIAAADMVVTDLTAAGEAVPDHLIRRGAQRIAVPVVSGAFLWPYAGQPHPGNAATPALPAGPYPAEFGDSFLDRMIADGVAEDAAVERYLALDIGRAADLDGRLEAALASLETLDAWAGFDLSAFVRGEFRTGNLFATATRLRLTLFRELARAVFRRMDVPPAQCDALPEAPFAPGAMPIHPGVLQHFQMASPLPNHLYPSQDEGGFTFEEFCHRYLRYARGERPDKDGAPTKVDPAAAAAGTPAKGPSPAVYAALNAGLPGNAAMRDFAPARLPALPAFPQPAVTWRADASVGVAVPQPALADNVPPFASQKPAAVTDRSPMPLAGLLASPEPGKAQATGFVAPAPDLALIGTLPNMRGLAAGGERPFAAMPEILPPPPLRPVLPPELHGAPKQKPGLVARLLGSGRR